MPGRVPAPYNQIGLGGAKIEAKFIDEAGPAANTITEFRNLVQRDHVDVVLGYVSSGNCLAIAPVAEELKELTVLDICGTPRVFEEKPWHYVFRVNPHATMDNVAAAKYVLGQFKNLTVYSGINQNYAWGQDSWRDFRLAMKDLDPEATVDKELFPKLFAGEYGAEISTLLTSNAQIIHSSFYDGDLEAFIYQAAARGLPQRIPLVLTVGETSLYRLGPKLPDGAIIAARGPHSFFAHDSQLNSLVPENLRRPLPRAASLSRLRFRAVAVGPEDRLGKGAGQERRRAADDGGSDRRVRGHLVSNA